MSICMIPKFRGGETLYKVVKGTVLTCTVTQTYWFDHGWSYLITETIDGIRHMSVFREEQLGRDLFRFPKNAAKVAHAYISENETLSVTLDDLEWIYMDAENEDMSFFIGRLSDSLFLFKLSKNGIWYAVRTDNVILNEYAETLYQRMENFSGTIYGRFNSGMDRFFLSNSKLLPLKQFFVKECAESESSIGELKTLPHMHIPRLYPCETDDSRLFADTRHWL